MKKHAWEEFNSLVRARNALRQTVCRILKIHKILKVYRGMKLIFGIYLDINSGRDFCEFIKSEHALKSLFKPKKGFDQSNFIISQIKIS